MSRIARVFFVASLAVCAFAVHAIAAQAATVTLAPCSDSENPDYGLIGGITNTAWMIESGCPSQVTFGGKVGQTIANHGDLFMYPYAFDPFGQVREVSFDLTGGDGSDTGAVQGLRICTLQPRTCGPVVKPSSSDVITPERHVLRSTDPDFPAGGATVHFHGECTTYPPTRCARPRPMTVKNLELKIEDNDRPMVQSWGYDDPDIVGTLVNPGGWNRSQTEFSVQYDDVGVGVKYVGVELHGASYSVGPQWKVPVGDCGSEYVTAKIPRLCPKTGVATHVANLNQASSALAMGQGTNYAKITAVDAAGNVSDELEFDFKVDSYRPTIAGLKTVPHKPNGWHSSEFVGLQWSLTSEAFETENQSGVVRADWKVTSLDAYNSTTKVGFVEGDAIESIEQIELPAPGSWQIQVTVTDRAGNASLPLTVPVYVDKVVPDPPSIASTERFSAPQLVAGSEIAFDPSANIADVASGICGYATSFDEQDGVDPGTHTDLPGDASSVDVPKHLPHGVHHLSIRAISCSGVPGAIAREAFMVDLEAPPAWLSEPGDSGWFRAGDAIDAGFWPESGARMRVFIDGFPGNWLQSSPVALTLGDGVHNVDIVTEDSGGNQSVSSFADVKVDRAAPTANLYPIDPRTPTRLTGRVVDSVSGLDMVVVEYRGVEGDWRSIDQTIRPASPTSPLDLNLRIPDEQLASGQYDLRIRAWDVAGNAAVVSQFGFNAPLRKPASLEAGFVSLESGKQQRRESLLVKLGKPTGARGVLRGADGEPIAGATVTVDSLVVGRSQLRLESVKTGADGGFEVSAPSGPSRVLRFRYGGDELHAPTSQDVRLLVSPQVSLKARRKRSGGGWRVRMSGRVVAPEATFPAGGKPMRLQFKARRGWQNFPEDVFAGADGRFELTRFFRTTRIGFVKVRAVVPAAVGWPYEAGTSKTVKVRLR